jgi:hypothetical protein
MKVDVYDTCATSSNGSLLHFDVIVPSGTDRHLAFRFACDYAVDLEPGIGMKQERCNFCHSENSSAAMLSDIQRQGFYILPMEGCPKTRS